MPRGNAKLALALTALSLFAASASCDSSPAPSPAVPTRECALTVWYKPASSASYVELVGSWDGWKRPGLLLSEDRGEGFRGARIPLPPGRYAYAIADDGQWVTDPRVPKSSFHEGLEVAEVDVPACGQPALRIEGAKGSADGHAEIDATFVSAMTGEALDPATLTFARRSGEAVVPESQTADPTTGKIHVSLRGLARGKHTLEVRAKDASGRVAEPALATAWIEPRPLELEDLSVYQIVVDRYRAKDGSALDTPSPLSGRAGGHLAGVTQAIVSGEISRMGFNALWVSPLYKNPEGFFPGDGGREYSSYHGYWPIASRELDARVAEERDVDALVAAAHERGIRVLFDVVPNHVHEQHPYWAEHKKDGWFNRPDGKCICGSSCDWASHIQECWFAHYMPDFDLRRTDVAQVVSSDALWWMDRFDADGVRIDAVPMMPRAATRRIAYDLRARFDHPGHKSFTLGENFTGPNGYGLIRYGLGPFGLDGKFNFPLLWALRGAIAEGSRPMSDIDASVLAGQEAWGGSGAVMGLVIGNHDVPRFASVSAGDGGGNPWTPALQATEEAIYQKQKMALAVVYTLSGAPVVYYGDEIALAGHADPDARRVMPKEDALTPAQRGTRDFLSRLAGVRACSRALRRGTYRTLFADAESLIYARELEGEPTAVVVVTRASFAPLEVPLPKIPSGNYVDALTESVASLRSELTTLPTEPFSVRLFLPAESPCVLR